MVIFYSFHSARSGIHKWERFISLDYAQLGQLVVGGPSIHGFIFFFLGGGGFRPASRGPGPSALGRRGGGGENSQ